MEKNEQENRKTLKYFQSMQLSQKNSNNLFCVQKWITVIEMSSGFVVFIYQTVGTITDCGWLVPCPVRLDFSGQN